MVPRVQLSRLVLRRQIVEKIKQGRQPDEGESRDDHITSMRLMRDACVTEGTIGAVRYHTTALRGSACVRCSWGDKMSPRYPPQITSITHDDGRMRD